MGGPFRPDAPDNDFLLGKFGGHFVAWMVSLHHEEVDFAGHVLDVLLFKEGVGGFANLFHLGAAFGNQGLRFQAGEGAGNTGDGQEAGTKLAHFADQIRAGHDVTDAEASHAVNLGESPHDDDVFAGGDHIGAGFGVGGEMNVGFVDEDDGVLLLVIEKVLDFFARGDGAGRVIGIADVIDAGVGLAFDHGLDIMRVIGGERNFDGFGADVFGSSVTVTGTSHGPAAGGGSEAAADTLQRVGRAGVELHVFGLDAFLLRDDADDFGLLIIGVVAPAVGGDAGHGFNAFRARALGVFILVDADYGRVRKINRTAATAIHAGAQLLFGILGHGEFEGQRGACHDGGNAAKLAAAKAAVKERFSVFGVHSVVETPSK